MSSLAGNLKVAYLLHRFPYLTETFIMREIYCLRQQGIDAEIFSLLPPKHTVVHEQAKSLLPFTHYSPLMSWPVLRAQLEFLVRSPRRYVRALVKTVWQTFREQRVMLLTLLLFPKCVYFASVIRRKEMDHMHAHFVWIDGIAAGIVSELIGTTFTIHPHAFGLFGRDQQNVRRQLENATQIVTISTYNRAYIQQLCPRRDPNQIHIVHCGIETDRLRPGDPARRPSGPARILAVGRLVEKKGFEYLIAACAELKNQGLTFECEIVGEGTRRNRLAQMIRELDLEHQVQLTGALSQEQIIHHYQECDIFALPCVVASDGDRDGVPVSLMEAMACEVPVVSTSLSGIPDLITDEQTGLLVKDRDVSGLCTALSRLIRDPILRSQLGKAGRQIILDEFDAPTNASRLAAIFRSVSGNSIEPERLTPCAVGDMKD